LWVKITVQCVPANGGRNAATARLSRGSSFLTLRDTHRLFRYGEQVVLCKAALASGPLTTRQLAQHVMTVKGLDAGDKVLAKAVVNQLINSLRTQARAGKIALEGKRHGVSVWRLPKGEDI
jgi:hypothetical protein